MRINAKGEQVGQVEYHTPQSQHLIDAFGDTMMTVNLQESMKVVVVGGELVYSCMSARLCVFGDMMTKAVPTTIMAAA